MPLSLLISKMGVLRGACLLAPLQGLREALSREGLAQRVECAVQVLAAVALVIPRLEALAQLLASRPPWASTFPCLSPHL